MRIVLVLCLLVLSTVSSHAVGIGQRFGLGSAVPDGIYSMQQQHEDFLRSRSVVTPNRRVSPISRALRQVARSTIPGFLGHVEEAARQGDDLRKFHLFSGTLLETEGELTGSYGDGNDNFIIQLRKEY